MTIKEITMSYLIMRDRPEVIEIRDSLAEAVKFAESIKPKDSRPSTRVYIYEEIRVFKGE